MRPRRSKRQAWNSKDVELNEGRCSELRKLVHELSNVTTGMLISSGLLRQSLAGDERGRYCEQINRGRRAHRDLGARGSRAASPRGEM